MQTSVQVREAIVRAFHEQGLTYEQIAELLDVGRATVSRVLRAYRENGKVEPRPRGGGNFSKIRGRIADRLRAIACLHPDLTVEEMTFELCRQTNVTVSRSAVDRALRRMGYTRKKRLSLPSSATRPRT